MNFRLQLSSALLVIGLMAAAAPSARAQGALAAPIPPCAGQLEQDFAPIGEAPSVRLWRMDSLAADWRPAACTGIERRDGAVLVAVAGRFESPLDGHHLLAKLGNVSQHTTINYWSAGDRQWQPLLEAAYALEDSTSERARADYTLDELKSGKTLYLMYDDAEAVGPVVSAVEIGSVDENGFSITTRNVTAARVIGLPIADPGDIASYLWVEREAGNVFRYFALASSALSMPLLRDESHISRAVAVYHYIAGIKGDEPAPPGTN
jgi:hypothetical protein